MHAKHVLVGLTTFGICVVIASADDTPSQQRYRERLEKERQLVKKFETEALVKELGDPYYYRREAAEQEMISRSLKAGPAAMAGLVHPDAEISSRSGRVLNGIRQDVWKTMDLTDERPLQIQSLYSYFWAGTNPHLGGVQDKSLDSGLKVVAPYPVKSVTSPATVKTAFSTRFESVKQQVWCSSTSECYQRREFSTNLYLQRPREKATAIWVLVELQVKVVVAEEIHIPLKIGTKVEPRKDITWANVRGIEKAEKGLRKVKLDVLDYAGRLHYAPVVGLDADGKVVGPPLITLPSAYRNTVEIEVGEKVSTLVVKPTTGPVKDKKVQGWVIITPPKSE